MGPAVFLLLLLRLGVGELLCLPPAASLGEPGLSPRPAAAHLRFRRHYHPVRHPSGGKRPAAGVAFGYAGRHGAGIRHRRRHGAAVSGALLGLLQAKVQPERPYLPVQLHRLGLFLHFAGAVPAPAGGPAAGGCARLAGGPGGHRAHRRLLRRCGPLRPGCSGPQGDPHPRDGGERGPAAAGQAGRGGRGLCRG